MAKELNPLTSLQAALRETFKCEVLHRETVPVHETMGGKTIWKGDVEVFELTGHPDSKKCFAWVHCEPGKSPRFVAVLGKKFADSPELAVKSAIFFDIQSPATSHPNLPS